LNISLPDGLVLLSREDVTTPVFPGQDLQVLTHRSLLSSPDDGERCASKRSGTILNESGYESFLSSLVSPDPTRSSNSVRKEGK
jgi:hypothetical protein